MRITTLICAAALLVLSVTGLQAQRRSHKYRYFTFEAMVGVSQYGGDLTTAEDGADASFPAPQLATLPTTQLGAAVGLTYQFHPNFSAKANFMFTRLIGDDYLDEKNPNVNRGLHFKSYVAELSGQLRYHFIANRTDYRFRPKIDPYIFGGIAVFYFDPYVIFENRDGQPDFASEVGNKINLRELQTDGVDYAPISISIPFGFGVRYAVNDRINVGVEFGLRRTFTDHLDDVSGTETSGDDEFGGYFYNTTLGNAGAGPNAQPSLAAELAIGGLRSAPGSPYVPSAADRRGNPSNNDWYAFSGVTFGYILQGSNLRCPKPVKPKGKKFIFF